MIRTVARSKAALALGVCACALLLPGAGVGQARSSDRDDAPRASRLMLMTYWEAKAAGRNVPPLPSETGIRPCTEADYSSQGFMSAEAAEEASDEYYAKWGEAEGPAYCQDDPRTMLFGTMPGRRSLLTRGAAVRRNDAQAEAPPVEGAQRPELEEEEEEPEGGGEGGDESGDRETDAG